MQQAAALPVAAVSSFGSTSAVSSNGAENTHNLYEMRRSGSVSSTEVTSDCEETGSFSSSASPPCHKILGRSEIDDFLIAERNRGTPYKDIKRLGGLREAESTLRGRYRTLTKSSEHRLRKPMWTKKDASFLTFAASHSNWIRPLT